MRYIRQLPVHILMALALLLAACGGGSTGTPIDPLTSAKATLTGEVLSIDGDASALDGVVLALRETGQIVESGADGWFSFGDVPAGTLTLDLVSASSLSAKAGDTQASHGNGGNDDAGNDDAGNDDAGNDNDLDGDCMNMQRVRAQERIHVRLRLQDGELCEMQCVREESAERETERHMRRTQTNADPDMRGEVEREQRQDRERLCIEVECAEYGRDLEAVVIAAGGSEESLGLRTVQADGECEWRIDTSQGGRLPFGASSCGELEGYRVQVRARNTGDPLLEGEIPGLPPFRGQGAAKLDQTRTEEQSQERVVDSDGDHDRDQDQDRDGNYGDDA